MLGDRSERARFVCSDDYRRRVSGTKMIESEAIRTLRCWRVSPCCVAVPGVPGEQRSAAQWRWPAMAGKKRNARSRRHGRHHKVPPPHTTGQWLRVGVVTAGLGAAIAAGQGVAGASPGDDSGSSGTESSGSASGSGSTNAPDTSTQDPDGAATMQASLSEEDSDTDTAPAANEVSTEQNSATGDGVLNQRFDPDSCSTAWR